MTEIVILRILSIVCFTCSYIATWQHITTGAVLFFFASCIATSGAKFGGQRQ